jgi:hypothetical protein
LHILLTNMLTRCVHPCKFYISTWDRTGAAFTKQRFDGMISFYMQLRPKEMHMVYYTLRSCTAEAQHSELDTSTYEHKLWI